jgi:hypothetical protein
MDEIISYTMCAVKVRSAKLRNYLKSIFYITYLRSSNDCIFWGILPV